MANLILTTTDDYDAVRGYLGVDENVISDTILASFVFIGVAEAIITKAIANQSASGVPSVSVILAQTSPATSADLIFLKAATAAYAAYLFTPSSPNAVNTSVTDGDQTIDLGGIGAQWIEQGEKALMQCEFYLTQLTNWPDTPYTALSISGPSHGVADTISGFLRSRTV